MSNPERHRIPLGFCDEMPLCGSHICYIYSDEDERRKVVSRFMSAGLEHKERVLCVTDTLEPDELVEVMGELGVDLTDEYRARVETAESLYYPQGSFCAEHLLESTETFFHEALHDGCVGARGTGEMNWASREVAGAERALEYEAQLTRLLERVPYTPLCQYDARLFSGEFLMNVLQVHPYMVVRGQLMQNPHFVDPDRFLGRHAS